MSLLRVSEVQAGYRNTSQISDITLDISSGEIVSIFGKNGAGKSTLLNVLVGRADLLAGSISIDDKDISDLSTHQISEQGIALVPSGRKLFPDHTVEENLTIGGYNLLKRGMKTNFDSELLNLLDLFPFMKERLSEKAGVLSGGEQQMVAIARALVSQPKFILLDEPCLGLAPPIIDSLWEKILSLSQRGQGILISEQSFIFSGKTEVKSYKMELGKISEWRNQIT